MSDKGYETVSMEFPIAIKGKSVDVEMPVVDLIRQYNRLLKEHGEITKCLDYAKAAICSAIGDGEKAVWNGITVAEWRNVEYSKIDYKALFNSLPSAVKAKALASGHEYTRETRYRRLTTVEIQ